MANAALKNKIESEIKDGFKRKYAGPVYKCNMPGCNIRTRSESGTCAACRVDAAVAELEALCRSKNN